MELKIAKSKKVSKALVVLPPIVSKGQKRKSKADSSKDKGKRKKSEKGVSTPTTSLEQNELYFDEDKSQERYNIDFSNGRLVDYNFFDFYNFE